VCVCVCVCEFTKRIASAKEHFQMCQDKYLDSVKQKSISEIYNTE